MCSDWIQQSVDMMYSSQFSSKSKPFPAFWAHVCLRMMDARANDWRFRRHRLLTQSLHCFAISKRRKLERRRNDCDACTIQAVIAPHTLSALEMLTWLKFDDIKMGLAHGLEWIWHSSDAACRQLLYYLHEFRGGNISTAVWRGEGYFLERKNF